MQNSCCHFKTGYQHCQHNKVIKLCSSNVASIICLLVVNDFQGLGFGVWNNLIHKYPKIWDKNTQKKLSQRSNIYQLLFFSHIIIHYSKFTIFNSLNFSWVLFDNPANKPTRHNVAGNYKAIIIFTWHGIIFMDYSRSSIFSRSLLGLIFLI